MVLKQRRHRSYYESTRVPPKAVPPRACAAMPMPHAYRFSDYLLDCNARELRLRGSAVPMPARVLECLQYLIEHRDRAVGRDELTMAVFARDNVSDAQLSQIVRSEEH